MSWNDDTDWDDDTDFYDDIPIAGNPNSSTYTTTITTTDFPRDFDKYYVSSPFSILQTHLESGNKIIMPASALDHLVSLEIVYPMVFRIENTYNGRYSHCGVIEFTAYEGFVFLPTWMMENMDLQQGELVNIKNVSLPKGRYIKIQPHNTKFTMLSDHKTLLENSFRNYACLTAGDTIVINHEGEKYKIDILETKPSRAVSMCETDCEVDFATPLDYKEPENKTRVNLKRKNNGDEHEDRSKDDKVNLFPGVGKRLDGTKAVKDDKSSLSVNQSMKKLKITNDSKVEVDHGKPKKGERIEFKPFSGVAKRVDGQPLAVDEVVVKDKSDVQVIAKGEHEGFKPFTGKSYMMDNLY